MRELFEILTIDLILFWELFSFFYILPTRIRLFFWHLLRQETFFRGKHHYLEVLKMLAKASKTERFKCAVKQYLDQIEQIPRIIRTRSLLSTENNNKTRQIINFATHVSFCFPFENQLPRATIVCSTMQNASERGKKILFDSLSYKRWIVNVHSFKIYRRPLTETVAEKTRQFRREYTKYIDLRRRQQKRWQTAETIFVFLICDLVLSKHCLPNMKP